MAITQASLQTAAWTPEERSSLSMGAQWLYVALLTEPDLGRHSLLPTSLCADVTDAEIQAAVGELAAAGLIHDGPDGLVARTKEI